MRLRVNTGTILVGNFLLIWICLISLGLVVIWKTNSFDEETEDIPSDRKSRAARISRSDNTKASSVHYSEVTVVTALFDIGSFPKIHNDTVRKPVQYRYWMQAVQSMDNPLIAFTDSRTIYQRFLFLRRKFPVNRTMVFLIERSSLWSFSIAKDIRAIHNQPNYPTFYPATMNENYSCVMHAKYELLQSVINKRLCKTKYISWVDVGLYRSLDTSRIFHVGLPGNFKDSCVSMSGIRPFSHWTPETIIKKNLIWVGGGIVMGRWEVIRTFAEDYQKALRTLIDHRLVHVDQQVLYCMYSKYFYFKPRVQIQTFNRGRDNDWFCLAEETLVLGHYTPGQ